MLHEEEFSESLKKILSAICRPDACCLIVFKDNHSECDKIKEEKVFFLFKEFSPFLFVCLFVIELRQMEKKPFFLAQCSLRSSTSVRLQTTN